MGQNYLDKLPRQPFVIDKLPLNYLNIGFIRMALPQSQILYLQRDAADHELALMKHLFNQAYPWSYDVDEIKCYRQAVESLCDTVIAEPDSNIQRLSYEQLINSPEATLAKIADYCGLNWSERDIHQALQFADNNQQPSTTGSASQVRNPLHNRSIGLAKRYGWA
ncbi:sulfotransferase family protein [Idiomarina seosinensis]|uniref:sulfotransferase family protein n=1 Tax=Idiomarina seosinensis TaxID=281739 RepID=UPI0013003994|nr:sulfotransferase [Idiomarina seosinensis]